LFWTFYFYKIDLKATKLLIIPHCIQNSKVMNTRTNKCIHY
jgi:hypothetical protein